MDWLKKILGEETFNKLTANAELYAEMQEKLKGEFVPIYRLNEVSEHNKSLKTQIEDRDKQIKDFKKSAGDNEELLKKISDAEKANKEQKETFDKEQANIKKSFAVKEHLLNAGVHDADARDLLSAKFSLDKVDLDEQGKIKGFDDMLKPIKENKALGALFGEVKHQGKKPGEGGNPNPKDQPLTTKEWISEIFQNK